jgi:pimeloyl-ACP methyl ester carboxylesterase
MLETQILGPDTAQPPILIVHGLFGSARNWGAIAKRLALSRQVISVDMRNHAGSPWMPSNSYPDMAADLAGVIAAHGGQADVIGHSMGGKAAMVLALTAPERVRRLVVADIAPVAYGHTQAPLIAAMRGLDLTGLTTRSAADARLAATVQEAPVRAFLLQSLDLKSDPPGWRLNLDVLDAEMPRIIGWPDIKGSFAGPVLFLTGAKSDYVRPEHHETIKGLFPQARFEVLENAGHWLHADNPRGFLNAVSAFLG